MSFYTHTLSVLCDSHSVEVPEKDIFGASADFQGELQRRSAAKIAQQYVIVLLELM